MFENGVTLAETERFPSDGQAAIADIDLDLLRQERLRMGSFDTNRRRARGTWRTIGFSIDPPMGDLGLRRRIERFPFVPSDVARLEQDCYEAYHIQVSGLAQRLRAIGTKQVVIGISGGLDSTQALIVCAQAFDLLGLPRSGIHAFTMPGFATSDHTKQNALRLMAVGWRRRSIPSSISVGGAANVAGYRGIRSPAARIRFTNITFENAGRPAQCRLFVPAGQPSQLAS